MYRSLSDFVCGVAERYVIHPFSFLSRAHLDDSTACDNHPKSNSRVPKFHWNQTPFNRIQVTVDTSYEQPNMSQTHDPSVSSEEQPRDKLHGHDPRHPLEATV
jgi:hypothetical protein